LAGAKTDTTRGDPLNIMEFVCATPGDIEQVETDFFDPQFASEEKVHRENAPVSAKFKDEHMEIFGFKRLAWPLGSAATPPHLVIKDRRAFGQRATESTFILDFLYRPRHHVEFIDSNHSLPRHLQYKLGDGEASFLAQVALKHPWRPVCPTITSLSKIVIRVTSQLPCDGPHAHADIVRPLEAWEVMSLIGWAPAFWRPYCVRPASDTMVSLAGNAFSAFAIGPIMLVGLIYAGGAREAMRQLQQQQPTTGAEGDDEESNPDDVVAIASDSE
jgi:hypothetical protein